MVKKFLAFPSSILPDAPFMRLTASLHGKSQAEAHEFILLKLGVFLKDLGSLSFGMPGPVSSTENTIPSRPGGRRGTRSRRRGELQRITDKVGCTLSTGAISVSSVFSGAGRGSFMLFRAATHAPQDPVYVVAARISFISCVKFYGGENVLYHTVQPGDRRNIISGISPARSRDGLRKARVALYACGGAHRGLSY